MSNLLGYRIVSEVLLKDPFTRGIKSAKLQNKFLKSFKQRVSNIPINEREPFINKLMNRLNIQATKRAEVFSSPESADAYRRGFYGTLGLAK